MNLSSLLTNHPSLFELTLFLISIVAGIFGSILGLGGGVIIVPALTLLFGIKIKYAIGASIISVIATSSGAAAAYVKDGITNIKVAIFLEIATSLGALSGACLSGGISSKTLYLLFSLMLLFSCWSMFKKHKKSEEHVFVDSPLSQYLKMQSSYPDHHLKREVPYGVVRIPLGFALMSLAGLISGLLGVGSGALKVPAMDSAMNLPIKVSSATSNFMIGVTAAASAGLYYMRGEIVPFLAAPVALGVLAGAWFGTRIMMKISNKSIRVVFVSVLAVIAIQMAVRGFS